MELIETVELASSASSITFSSIPQTYTDLKILISARTDLSSNVDGLVIKPNNTTTNFSSIRLYGSGSSVNSGSLTNNEVVLINGNTTTTSTFSNASVYISNYSSSANKSLSSDSVTENNGTQAYTTFYASLWSNSSAITSLVLASFAGNNFLSGTTASLYGITAGGSGTVS